MIKQGFLNLFKIGQYLPYDWTCHDIKRHEWHEKKKKTFFWDSLEIDISHIKGHKRNPPNTLSLKVM
jgi:hypothetical protein